MNVITLTYLNENIVAELIKFLNNLSTDYDHFVCYRLL